MLSMTLLSRRKPVSHQTPGRELTDSERRQLPAGFEAVGEALVSGANAVAACAVTGRSLACDGASLGEALSGLRATYDVLGEASPGFAEVEALCVAWSESTLDFLHELSCEDPLTGLASLAHLRTRIAEVYREAERQGANVSSTHALVVVDVAGTGKAPGDEAPFHRALRLAGVAEGLRTIFSGEETIGRTGPHRAVALVRRTPDLGETVGVLREMLEDLRVADSLRLWIEGLPAGPDLAVRVLSELARP